MEDMCIYGNFVKNEILNKKKTNPEKFIPTEVALNNEQQDPGVFALALIASDLKNKGIEAAIVNDNVIVDKKEKEDEENSAFTCLQFMASDLLFKKTYVFHFDLDDNRVNEILNTIIIILNYQYRKIKVFFINDIYLSKITIQMNIKDSKKI